MHGDAGKAPSDETHWKSVYDSFDKLWVRTVRL